MFRPAFLRWMSRRPSPAVLANGAFAAIVNRAARDRNLARRLVELDGKRIGIRATELPWPLEIVVEGAQASPAPPGEPAHVVVSGSFLDLWRLASRREDADTLFFERRLCIEGETETGVLLRNALEAVDWNRESLLGTWPTGPRMVAALLAMRCIREISRGRRG
jgi:predicted lipid carrier protein YhbT